MGYYAENPHERDEPPRCVECDECMVENNHMGMRLAWECHNPGCENCNEIFKAEYIARCHDDLLNIFDEPVKVKVRQAGRAPAWWDGMLGDELEPVGIDVSEKPMAYVLEDGRCIPCTCVDLVSGVRPESGQYTLWPG